MRLAAFNVENLFQRVKAFNDEEPETHRDILDAHSELNKLFEAPPPGTPCGCCERARPLLLDHDHRTNMFRGWLCRECNSGLGFLGDNLEGVGRAFQYLGG